MKEFMYCPLCLGVGQNMGKECRECAGIGIFLTHSGYQFYWGHRIDEPHILLRRIEKTLRLALDFILLFIGIIGVFILFWIIFFETTEYTVKALLNIWESQDAKIIIFWLTVLSDCYLFYRLFKRFEFSSPIPKDFSFDGASSGAGANISWNELKKLPHAKLVDISGAFSDEALNIAEKSYEIAKRFQDGEIRPPHLMQALIQTKDITHIFLRLGVSFSRLRDKLTGLSSALHSPMEGKIALGGDVKLAFFSAFQHGILARKKRIDVFDVLFGVLKVSDTISELLYDMDIDMTKIENVSLWSRFQKNLKHRIERMHAFGALRSNKGMNRTMTAIATPLLDSLSDDQTQLAKLGYLEPCIGREKEIKEIFEILSSGAKQNTVLVGDPGVGKRSILSGIAQLMVSEDVPEMFRDKRLVSISVSRLVSGATASLAEERLLRVFQEVIRSENIILCIQNITHLIGISSGGSSSMDLAGVLAEVLSKKQIQVIATSTRQDYTEYLENSGALGEVLEKIEVKEVEKNTAVQILESKAGLIEYKFGVFFTYDALVNAVELTARYLHERYLPEKAIEIMEETASRIAGMKGKQGIIFADDIAQTVSEKTDIPLTNITQSESEKLLNLEEEIHKRMVDQDEAVSLAASALRRARAEIRDQKRPIVNLMFLGPTGVGKTQLAKTVAAVYFGGEGKMIRLDMSEYQEKTSIYRLIGFPPGSQGKASDGYLTEEVRHHPFSLLLLDEIEKAHPDILNVFLQVMDDARITDSKGRVIDFTNVILICTSNAGTKTIQKRIREKRTLAEIKEELLNKELFEYFRPEFLNRFDGIVVFKPLEQNEIRQIAKLLLEGVRKDLEKKGIYFQITDGALDELVEKGYDPVFGARPMRRAIQDTIDNKVAEYILSGKVSRRDKIIFDIGGRIDVVKSRKY